MMSVEYVGVSASLPTACKGRNMSCKLYIWKNSPSNVGHASLEVNSKYMSYWPRSAAGKKDFKIGQSHEPSFPKSYAADRRLEGEPAHHTLILNNLDEAAICTYWNQFKMTPNTIILSKPQLLDGGCPFARNWLEYSATIQPQIKY